MTKEEFIDALQQTVEDLGDPSKDDEYGWGRVNAFEALTILYSQLFMDDFETGDVSRWSSSSP